MQNLSSLFNRYPLVYLVLLPGVLGAYLLLAPSQDSVTANSENRLPESQVAMLESGEITPDKSNVTHAAQSQLESLRKRVVDNPKDTTHVFRLARMLQDAHQLEEAARNYRHYLSMHPNNRQAWLDLSQCLGQLQKWPEAMRAIQGMLEIYPQDTSGRYNLGAIHANMENMEEARKIWIELAEEDLEDELSSLVQMSLLKLGGGFPQNHPPVSNPKLDIPSPTEFIPRSDP